MKLDITISSKELLNKIYNNNKKRTKKKTAHKSLQLIVLVSSCQTNGFNKSLHEYATV